MELGNAIFGNSRGEFRIPRGEGYEQELYRLFEVCEPTRDNSWREYGVEFENEVFEIHQYYWGDCTCGYEERWAEKENEWTSKNRHAPNCYQSELSEAQKQYDSESGYGEMERRAFPPSSDYLNSAFNVEVEADGDYCIVSMSPRDDDAMQEWRSAHTKRQSFVKSLYKRLCKKYNKPELGCAVHCTCGHDARYRAFAETDNHDPCCPIVLPNFRFKPTGYELHWYKYPLRDSYQSANLSLVKFREMISTCIASVSR